MVQQFLVALREPAATHELAKSRGRGFTERYQELLDAQYASTDSKSRLPRNRSR